MPEPKAPAHSKRLALLAAIFAVAFPLLVIALMIWSPWFLQVSGRALEPVKNYLDKLYEGWDALWLLVELPVILFAVIVVHEIGHLVSGLVAGFRFVSIQFGPLRIDSPFRVSFRSLSKTGGSGFIHMIPCTSQKLRSRALLLCAAGPFADLLAGTILLLYRGHSFHGAELFAGFSILTGAGNLVPFRRLSVTSDGKRILSILRNDHQTERFLSLLQLTAELRNGTAFEDLPKDFLANVTAFKDDSQYTVAGYALAYSAAWYGQSADEAAQLLETCLEYSAFTSSEMREALKSDAAVFQARKRKNIDLADQWQSEIAEKPDKPWLKLRVQAAILEAKGDVEGALRKLDETENALRTIPNPFQRSVSLRFLERWRSELQSTGMASSSPLPGASQQSPQTAMNK